MGKLQNDIKDIIESSLGDLSEELIDRIFSRIKNDELYNAKSKDPFIVIANINKFATAVRIFTANCIDYAEFKFGYGVSIIIDLSKYGYTCIRDHTNWNTYFYDERELSLLEYNNSIIVDIYDEDGGIHPKFIITGASVPGSGSNVYTIHFTDHEQKKKEIFFDRIFKDEFKDKKIYFRDNREKPGFDEILI